MHWKRCLVSHGYGALWAPGIAQINIITIPSVVVSVYAVLMIGEQLCPETVDQQNWTPSNYVVVIQNTVVLLLH